MRFSEDEFASIEAYHRRHTKMRMRTRYAVELSDEGYDDLCQRVAQGPIISRSEAGRPDQDIVVLDWQGIPVIVGWHRKLKLVTTALPPPDVDVKEGECKGCKSLQHQVKQLRASVVKAPPAPAPPRSPRDTLTVKRLEHDVRCAKNHIAALERKIERLKAHVRTVEAAASGLRRLATALGATYADIDRVRADAVGTPTQEGGVS